MKDVAEDKDKDRICDFQKCFNKEIPEEHIPLQEQLTEIHHQTDL